jgi:hypothetical protein
MAKIHCQLYSAELPEHREDACFSQLSSCLQVEDSQHNGCKIETSPANSRKEYTNPTRKRGIPRLIPRLRIE